MYYAVKYKIKKQQNTYRVMWIKTDFFLVSIFSTDDERGSRGTTQYNLITAMK